MCLGGSMGFEPNYSNYSLEELYDVLEHIDHDRYPDRVKKINESIQIKAKEKPVKNKSKKLTEKDKCLYPLLILIAILITTLVLGFLPMKGFTWVNKEQEPIYFWSVVSGFSIWALFYINKYIKVK